MKTSDLSEKKKPSRPATFSDVLTWRNRLLYCVLFLMFVYMILVSGLGLGDSRIMTPLAQSTSRVIFFGGVIWVIVTIIRNKRTLKNLIRLKEQLQNEKDEMNQSIHEKSGGTVWNVILIAQLIITDVTALSNMPAFYASFITLWVILLIKGCAILYLRYVNTKKNSIRLLQFGIIGCGVALLIGCIVYFYPMTLTFKAEQIQDIQAILTEHGVKEGQPYSNSTVYDDISDETKDQILDLLRQYPYSRTFSTLFSNGTIHGGEKLLHLILYDRPHHWDSFIIASNDHIIIGGNTCRMKNSEELIQKILVLLEKAE